MHDEPVFVPKKGQVDFTNTVECPVINCIVECEGKILLMKRSKVMKHYPSYYSGVTGYLDEPEKTIKEKVLEELQEEAGIMPSDILSIDIKNTLRQEPKEYDKVWIVHPVHVTIKKTLIQTDWEAEEHIWVDPKDIGNYNLIPDLPILIKLFYPEIELTVKK